ncbi:hypothetical protein GCM10010172_64570 [Paractinoplanes ferrugineus]|uniref:Uncharacterized protein n=1 Tax=Paractinoplanes ferrugineus TaxID=113564 RepID=A0A919JAB5_9ACTN|nr:hypothetical protein [Actinoplanes ferrugineus]GIE15973.1 hypothetical protein Afe05nite_78130 [Actinoplanes ferrugineus]
MTPSLYVAHDERMVIVSLLPLEVVGGRGMSYGWGSVLEMAPAEPATEPGPLTGVLCGVGGVSGMIGALLLLGGALTGGIFLLGGVTVAGGAILHGWRQRPGVISAPRLASDREQHHVLVEDRDRKLFSDAIDLCQRTSQTWPALGALIDAPVAERQLARALFDLAGALERRQELRELHAALAEHDGAFELAPRMLKAGSALAALDDEVGHRLATLNAVAVAGEELIRDQRITALAREADEALARLTSTGLPIVADAGSELAERTEAVLRAYRELT